jgi:hypothetical protein
MIPEPCGDPTQRRICLGACAFDQRRNTPITLLAKLKRSAITLTT